MNDIKVYVDVVVGFRKDGVMIPRQITWDDGEKYEIERVTDIRQAKLDKRGLVLEGRQRWTIHLNLKL